MQSQKGYMRFIKPGYHFHLIMYQIYFSFFNQEIGQYTGYGHDYVMTVNKGWKILNSQNVLDSIKIQHKTHQDLNDPVLL